MLLELTQFFKKHQKDLVLLIFVILISLLSFTIGFIVAKQKEREPLRIEQHDTNTLMIHQFHEYLIDISIIGVNS